MARTGERTQGHGASAFVLCRAASVKVMETLFHAVQKRDQNNTRRGPVASKGRPCADSRLLDVPFCNVTTRRVVTDDEIDRLRARFCFAATTVSNAKTTSRSEHFGDAMRHEGNIHLGRQKRTCSTRWLNGRARLVVVNRRVYDAPRDDKRPSHLKLHQASHCRRRHHMPLTPAQADAIRSLRSGDPHHCCARHPFTDISSAGGVQLARHCVTTR